MALNETNTRESIILHALTQFSERGYEGVSMRDIASAVGIKAASIYNHFESKEAIFTTIIQEMTQRYEEAAMAIKLPQGNNKEASEYYISITEEELIESAIGMFLYFLKDEFASKFRRMLTVAQYNHQIARVSFISFMIDSAIEFQTGLFTHLMEQGKFVEADPEIMAYHFYGPIYLLLNKYDSLVGEEEEGIEILEKHVRQFNRLYRLEHYRQIHGQKNT